MRISRLSYLFSILLTVFTQTISAQKTAILETGDTIILLPDHSWFYKASLHGLLNHGTDVKMNYTPVDTVTNVVEIVKTNEDFPILQIGESSCTVHFNKSDWKKSIIDKPDAAGIVFTLKSNTSTVVLLEYEKTGFVEESMFDLILDAIVKAMLDQFKVVSSDYQKIDGHLGKHYNILGAKQGKESVIDITFFQMYSGLFIALTTTPRKDYQETKSVMLDFMGGINIK